MCRFGGLGFRNIYIYICIFFVFHCEPGNLDQWLHGFSSACIAEIRGDLNPPLKREIIEQVDISHNSSMDPLSFRGQRQNMAKGRLQENPKP